MAKSIHSDKRKLVTAVTVLLTFGFAATALTNYFMSRAAICDTIIASSLPLTSDNIYSEIQKDLLRPVLISSLMASDTFVHDWVNSGEKDVQAMTRYLHQIRDRYKAFTSFFVSERSHTYYQSNGVLKKVDVQDPRDTWYFRVRAMQTPFELNVDPDAANKDALTIFINYRVLDTNGQYIGATGVGLTVDAVRQLIESYQQRYQRSVYFVDTRGVIMLYGRGAAPEGRSIQDVEGLKNIADMVLKDAGGTYRYTSGGHTQLLNVRFIPELNWHLFVTQDQDVALAGIRRTLYINLAISALITLVVVLLTTYTIGRYQRRLQQLATTDSLTRLSNRQGFAILVPQAIKETLRNKQPLLAIMIDIDHFKSVNDRFGHAAGDHVLAQVAAIIQQALRSSDFVFRWGGEEYLVVAKSRAETEALALAEKIRKAVGSRRIEHEGKDMSVTISAGAAVLQPGESIDEWIARADRALYASKERGRNVVGVS